MLRDRKQAHQRASGFVGNLVDGRTWRIGRVRRLAIAAATATAACGLCGSARAALVTYSAADSNTKHLWHFDEASGATATADAVGSGFALTASNSATLGAPSFSGFGNAGSAAGSASTQAFTGSAITPANFTSAAGAFSIDAMVNLAALPAGTTQQIATMEGNNGAARTFQFRLNTTSGGVTTLEFLNVSTGQTTGLTALVPTTGANAFAANTWFHAAVTYNGAEGTANNLKLFWTKVDPTVTQANEIDTGLQMNGDLLSTNSDTLVIGNTGRGPGGAGSGVNSLDGLIDEVRFSSIDRAPTDFIFAPEPGSIALLGLGGVGLLARRRRKA